MDERVRPSIVIARVGTTGKKLEGCKVILHGEAYPDIYNQVYGPASERECEKWMHANCAKSGQADK